MVKTSYTFLKSCYAKWRMHLPDTVGVCEHANVQGKTLFHFAEVVIVFLMQELFRDCETTYTLGGGLGFFDQLGHLWIWCFRSKD